MTEKIQWALLIFATASGIFYAYNAERRINRLTEKLSTLDTAYRMSTKLIITEGKKRLAQTKALERLTDPAQILVDMENSARVKEMIDANRKTLPREDAGPPAKVHSPTLRAKVPKSNYIRPAD